MFRTSDIILIAVMLSAAAFTYKTKHDAQAMMNRIASLETQISLEQDTIDVLRADWSLLTQPGRLAELAKVYQEDLGLELLEAKQVVAPGALGEIPLRGVTVEELIVQNHQLGRDRDPVVTGGVRP